MVMKIPTWSPDNTLTRHIEGADTKLYTLRVIITGLVQNMLKSLWIPYELH